MAIAVYAVLSDMVLGHYTRHFVYALIEIKDKGDIFEAPPNSFLQLSTLDSSSQKECYFYMLPVVLGGVAAYIISIKKKILSKNFLHFSILLLYGIIVFAVSITGYWAPGAQLIPLEEPGSILVMVLIYAADKIIRTKKPGINATHEKFVL